MLIYVVVEDCTGTFLGASDSADRALDLAVNSGSLLDVLVIEYTPGRGVWYECDIFERIKHS